MPAKQHDYTDTAKDMIGRTIGRVKREAKYLDFLMNTYPDACTDGNWEFYKKIETVINEERD